MSNQFLQDEQSVRRNRGSTCKHFCVHVHAEGPELSCLLCDTHSTTGMKVLMPNSHILVVWFVYGQHNSAVFNVMAFLYMSYIWLLWCLCYLTCFGLVIRSQTTCLLPYLCSFCEHTKSKLWNHAGFAKLSMVFMFGHSDSSDLFVPASCLLS